MNYYDILGLSEQSEPEVIEAAYRALMKKYHPDRWTGKSADAERRAKLINEAYAALRDNRNEYDWPLEPRKAGGRRAQKTKTPPDKRTDRTAARKQPRQQVASKAPRSPFGFKFGRSELIGMAVLLIGVAALALALAGGAARTPYNPIQTMLLPPARVRFLEGQRLQIFCITNADSQSDPIHGLLGRQPRPELSDQCWRIESFTRAATAGRYRRIRSTRRPHRTCSQ